MSEPTVSEGNDPGDDAGTGREPTRSARGATGTGGAGGAGGASAPDGSASRRRAPRLDPLAVRRLLKSEGLKARHSLSQNFLADPDVLQAILDLAAPAPGERVLEVGPGLGVLTGGLLEAGASVTAVELDRRLAGRLRERHAAEIETGQLRLVEGDILDQDISTLMGPSTAAAADAAPYEVVANVPYHITSPILHRFLGSETGESGRGAGRFRPRRMVLMLQREVAERIAAEPGAMSYLSVFVQYHAEVRIAFVVPRGAFEPQPEVESAVVEIRLRPAGLPGTLAGDVEPTPEPLDEGDLWRLVQAGFRERRKKLHNVLARQLSLPGDKLAPALEAAGIDGDRRPQTLSVAEWLALGAALGPMPGSTALERERAGAKNGHGSKVTGHGGDRSGGKRAGRHPR